MRLPPFQYLEPTNIDEALAIIDANKNAVKILAGGIEVIHHLKLRLIQPTYLLNIRKLSKLEGISEKDNKIIIGANTTIKEIANSPLMKEKCKAVAEAAFQVASPTLAAMGTVGGNILQNTRCMYYNQSEIVLKGLEACHKRGGTVCLAVPGGKRCFSVYQGDLAPALIALNTECVLEKKGSSRTIPLIALFSGNGVRPFTIEANEMLTQVIIQKPKGIYGSAYKKLRIRGSIDYPLASAAAYLLVNADFKVTASRIVIGAAGSAPKVIERASAALEGKFPEDADVAAAAEQAYEQSEAIDNLSMPGAYRRKMVGVQTKRAIQTALEAIKRRR